VICEICEICESNSGRPGFVGRVQPDRICTYVGRVARYFLGPNIPILEKYS
jgi:hypothetical protein